jgi:hypothetical protein
MAGIVQRIIDGAFRSLPTFLRCQHPRAALDVMSADAGS